MIPVSLTLMVNIFTRSPPWQNRAPALSTRLLARQCDRPPERAVPGDPGGSGRLAVAQGVDHAGAAGLDAAPEPAPLPAPDWIARTDR